jgi:hypothetical protein
MEWLLPGLMFFIAACVIARAVYQWREDTMRIDRLIAEFWRDRADR